MKIDDYIPQADDDEISIEIINGLTADQKYIPSKYFYDARGSQLFEEITHLDEYYPTRTEQAILRRVLPDIFGMDSRLMREIAESEIETNGIDIVELGSGDPSKISILFDSIPDNLHGMVRYVPVDISKSAIINASKKLATRVPDISIHGIVADFYAHLDKIPNGRQRIFCFFGSSIGNLSRDVAKRFIIKLNEIMNPGDRLLLGLDMVKDVAVLERAYNDKKGITAAFNRNILDVVNRLIESNFVTGDFGHMAFYNQADSRIEMHLRACRDMTIRSPHLPQGIEISAHETIRTEYSHKFTYEHIEDFANAGGFSVENIFCDSNGWFSLVDYLKDTAV